MSGDEQHTDWCEEHDDGCATDWRGARDIEHEAEILTRVLQRDGQPPVVQVSLRVGEQDLVGDFSPIGAPTDRIGSFSDTLAGEVGLAWDAHAAFEKR